MRISTEMLKPQGLCTGSHCLECFSQISLWDIRRPSPTVLLKTAALPGSPAPPASALCLIFSIVFVTF